MIIPLTDDWRIESDAHSWMVQRRTGVRKTGKRAGEVEWKAQTWHANPEQALHAYAERRQRDISADSYQGIALAMEGLRIELARIAESLRLPTNPGTPPDPDAGRMPVQAADAPPRGA